MRCLENPKVFIAIGGAVGIVVGLFRAWERAPLRNRVTPDVYFTEASDWLCIQQKWGNEAGKRQAVDALGKTYLAKTDPTIAAQVEQTKTAFEAGKPLCAGRTR